MNELALFAGAGGGLIATTHLLGWRCAAAVESNPYRREVLLRRQQDGVLPLFPIWDDVTTFSGHGFRDRIDVVTAGFPCQPFSVAGRRSGVEGDKRNLWPHTFRVVCEARPSFVFLENVPGLLAGSHGYFGTILRNLAQAGYDARWGVLSAEDCGAPHLRKRLWIVAHSVSEQVWVKRWWSSRQDGKVSAGAGTNGKDGEVADTDSGGREGEREPEHKEEQSERGDEPNGRSTPRRWRGTDKITWWEAQSDICRVLDGVAYRVDRLAAIGDGQVPAVAAAAWEWLNEKS